MVNCVECDGAGDIECPWCDADGIGEDGVTECDECIGIAYIDCTECGGSGLTDE